MQTIADELVESWINGNRKYVVQQVCTERNQARAALLSALIFSQLDTSQRTTFLRLLVNRVNDQE
jgi:hypothetical protein